MTRLAESKAKTSLVREHLEQLGYDAVIIKKQSNFSWITSGGRGFIGLASESSCGSIVVSRDGVYLSSNNIEAPRLLNEELPPGFAELISVDWQLDGTLDDIVRSRFGKVTDDTQMDGWFKQVRSQLCIEEANRFEQLGAKVAAILEETCSQFKPGMTEFDAAGLLAQRLWSNQIEPITLLLAADDRSQHVRHFPPTDNVIHEGVIASICARRNGLVVSATRSVAFKKGFAVRHRDLLNVEQHIFEALKPGQNLGGIMRIIMDAYTQNGFPEEWHNHHQGGITGYLAREYRANATSNVPVNVGQAHAWNPSASGCKCEETVLVTTNGLRILTPASEKWPVHIIGKWKLPDVLRNY